MMMLGAFFGFVLVCLVVYSGLCNVDCLLVPMNHRSCTVSCSRDGPVFFVCYVYGLRQVLPMKFTKNTKRCTTVPNIFVLSFLGGCCTYNTTCLRAPGLHVGARKGSESLMASWRGVAVVLFALKKARNCSFAVKDATCGPRCVNEVAQSSTALSVLSALSCVL